MVYTADVGLPLDNHLMKPSDENIELICLQRNLGIQKHGDIQQKLIDELKKWGRLWYNKSNSGFTEQRLRIGISVLLKVDIRPTELHLQGDKPLVIKESTPKGVYTLMTANSHMLRMGYNGSKLKWFNGPQDDFYYASEELHRRDAKSKCDDSRR